MKVARKAPAMPSSVVKMKPRGSFGPGERKRAMMPATNPITMIQMMFDTTISYDFDASSDVRRSMRPGSRRAALSARNAILPNFGAWALFRIAVGRHPFSSCVDRRPATRPYSVRLLARHHVLHKSGDDREDRAASAAADDLTDDGSDIEAAAGRACDRWHRG